MSRPPDRSTGAVPIGSYAVISDHRTAALVAQDGAIDWMCAPRFDDPPVLGRLLDPGAGVAELHPTDPDVDVQRAYVEDTNVLQTRWTTSTGTVVLTDALVALGTLQRFSQLLRRVECVKGSVELEWRIAPRFGWEGEAPAIRAARHGHVLAHGSVEMLAQAFDLGEPVIADAGVVGRGTLEKGQTGLLSLMVNHEFPLLASSRAECEDRLESTVAYWRAWMSSCDHDGPWPEAVRRSILAIGACVHDETGAIVAAPTTSLPESAGGDRNWDYRYCWVRDTCFALDAAGRLGMWELAQAALGWLLRAQSRTHPRINVFFDLDGEPFAPARAVPMAGWKGSTPVREGNDAGEQLQLGSFGDLMETAWLFVRGGNELDRASGQRLAEVASFLCEVWQRPDSGIWELDDTRNYTLSKMLSWAALDRAERLGRLGQLPGADRARWRAAAEEIRAFVEDRCLGPGGVLMRDGDGSGELDCGVLLAPATGFLEARDPRFEATMDRLRSELGAGGALLYRYSGMGEEENAFLPCSFWMAEGLVRAGRRDEAAAMMDELLGYANDVGLLAEELRPADHALIGNFPQALTHLALISAALSFEDGTARGD